MYSNHTKCPQIIVIIAFYDKHVIPEVMVKIDGKSFCYVMFQCGFRGFICLIFYTPQCLCAHVTLLTVTRQYCEVTNMSASMSSMHNPCYCSSTTSYCPLAYLLLIWSSFLLTVYKIIVTFACVYAFHCWMTIAVADSFLGQSRDH